MNAAHPTRQRAVCAAQSYHKHACAAQQWLRTVPHHTLMHQACSLHPAMSTVTLHVIAASTAACERQQAMRNLFAMDSVTARAILTRVEDKLVSVFLSQQRQQQYSEHASTTSQDISSSTELHEADKVLRRLQGQTVSESNASKEEMSCLLRVHRQYGGLQGTEQALREANGSCVRMSWIYNALEGCKRGIALQFLDGEIGDIDEQPEDDSGNDLLGHETVEVTTDSLQDANRDDDQGSTQSTPRVARSCSVKIRKSNLTRCSLEPVPKLPSKKTVSKFKTAQSPRVTKAVSRKRIGESKSQSKIGSRKQHTVSRVDSGSERRSRYVPRGNDHAVKESFISSRVSEMARLGISEDELQAAEDCLQAVPMRLLMSREFVIEQDVYIVGLKITVASPACHERAVVTRRLMPDLARVRLNRFNVLVEQQLIDGFLCKHSSNELSIGHDLKGLDKLLRGLQGKPVDDTASDADLTCLLRCYRQFDGYNTLARALRKVCASGANPARIAIAVNSAKRVIARRELTHLSTKKSNCSRSRISVTGKKASTPSQRATIQDTQVKQSIQSRGRDFGHIQALISQASVTQAEIGTAVTWLSETSYVSLSTEGFIVDNIAYRVALKIMVVAPAEQTRSAFSRMLMPEVSPCKLSGLSSRSEEQLINGFLSQQQFQELKKERDLPRADKILRNLHGKPVDDSTGDENMACLMRCYRHSHGYTPLANVIRDALGSCVDSLWVATTINSTKQLLARRELSRLDCVPELTTSSQEPASKPIKRSRHQSCNADYEDQHAAKRAPMRANHETPNTHSHASCRTMQHSLGAVMRMTRAREVQHVTENGK
jgi:hypothetical protein